MDVIKEIQIERAILVGLKLKEESRHIVEEHLSELEMLADTAGAETIIKVIQERHRPDKAFYLGKGKAEELIDLVELNDIDIIIFDDDLAPTQVRNLEKLLEKKILDRSGLILDIFAAHAKTKQSKTQVELAQLQYMLPRLTRAWTHLSKQYGGIGTKGPGETQIETDRRLIRTRISKLKENLRKIESQNRTKSLRRNEYLTASLVGYTNAGKSTLINLLTDADVLSEDKLFATLDSTTRSFDIDKNKQIMISDTVGFIRKLPHNLIESFKSTLNVVRDSDIILHVIDFSHPFFEDHIQVVNETLKELKCDNKPIIHLFNKIDQVEDKSKIEFVKDKFDDAIIISAARAINISAVKDKLVEIYESNYNEKSITLNAVQSKLVSQIHSLAEVTKSEYIDDKVMLTFKTDAVNHNKIERLLNES